MKELDQQYYTLYCKYLSVSGLWILDFGLDGVPSSLLAYLIACLTHTLKNPEQIFVCCCVLYSWQFHCDETAPLHVHWLSTPRLGAHQLWCRGFDGTWKTDASKSYVQCDSVLEKQVDRPANPSASFVHPGDDSRQHHQESSNIGLSIVHSVCS